MDNGKELHSESPWVGNYLGMSHAKFNTIHLPRLRPLVSITVIGCSWSDVEGANAGGAERVCRYAGRYNEHTGS